MRCSAWTLIAYNRVHVFGTKNKRTKSCRPKYGHRTVQHNIRKYNHACFIPHSTNVYGLAARGGGGREGMGDVLAVTSMRAPAADESSSSNGKSSEKSENESADEKHVNSQ